MAFDLCSGLLYNEGEPFDFFEESDAPTSVFQAVEMMRLEESAYWKSMAKDIFDVEGVYLSTMDVMDKIIERNSCDTLGYPCRVYVDHHYYVTVYAPKDT